MSGLVLCVCGEGGGGGKDHNIRATWVSTRPLGTPGGGRGTVTGATPTFISVPAPPFPLSGRHEDIRSTPRHATPLPRAATILGDRTPAGHADQR